MVAVEGGVDLVRDAGLWLAEVLGELNVERVDQLCLAKCKTPRKEHLAARLLDAIGFVRDYIQRSHEEDGG